MPSFNLQQRLTKLNSGQIGNVAEVSDDLVSTPTTNGWRTAAGSGTLVSGTATIATGLDTVRSFTASLSRTTGAASGVTEVDSIYVGTITTGSVVVTGAYAAATGVTIMSASGTSVFYWLAFGT